MHPPQQQMVGNKMHDPHIESLWRSYVEEARERGWRSEQAKQNALALERGEAFAYENFITTKNFTARMATTLGELGVLDTDVVPVVAMEDQPPSRHLTFYARWGSHCPLPAGTW